MTKRTSTLYIKSASGHVDAGISIAESMVQAVGLTVGRDITISENVAPALFPASGYGYHEITIYGTARHVEDVDRYLNGLCAHYTFDPDAPRV